MQAAAGAAIWLAIGCPQMLDDEFTLEPRNLLWQSADVDAGTPANHAPDASAAGAGGTGGSGGAAGAGGTGGSGGAAGAGGNGGNQSGGGTGGGSTGGAGGAFGSADAGPDGSSDASSGGDAAPPDRTAALRAALRHRFSFDGTGSAAIDSASGANGSLRNVELTGTGVVELDGSTGFVSMENNLLSVLTSTTIEMWATWAGGSSYQRLFDFGSSNAGEASRGLGLTYLFVSPSSPGTGMIAAYANAGVMREVRISTGTPLPSGAQKHVALVVDGPGQTMKLYLDAVEQASGTLNQPLSLLDDVNAWIGLSQFDSDPYFEGSVSEFRIYDAPLGAADLQLSLSLGPDASL